MNRLLPAFCAVSMVVLLTACSRTPTSEEGERALRQRVTQWWAARQTRDHDAMYRLYDPAYRARTDKNRFLQENLVRTRFDILSHEVQGIERESATRAKVKVAFRFLYPPAGGVIPGRVEEIWILVEGSWFKEYQPITPPVPQPYNP